ncbi:MAG: DUF5715 family protein [Prevotella sp.]|jgi:hypothetical protein
MKIKKNQFLQAFLAITIILALVRCVYPEIASDKKPEKTTAKVETEVIEQPKAQVQEEVPTDDSLALRYDSAMAIPVPQSSCFYKPDGSLIKDRIYSVPNFGDAFPDLNDVQLLAAEKWGVKPSNSREEMEERKQQLVYMASNPYYYVDRLRNSQPYLVPRAAVLLQDIGRNFLDSLQKKGIPLHKVIVTSVMRSESDMQKLRGRNSNAALNSCHKYGTTFDMCYNRYKTVEPPDGPKRRQVRNDTLKWVLAEVLNDMRENNRCLIKYEVKQGCFHITVK